MASLPGCTPERPIDLQQNRYLSREDCRHDWGDDENCPAVLQPLAGSGSGNGGSGGGGGGVYYYFGPRYYWDNERDRPVKIGADGEARLVEKAGIGRAGSGLGESLHVGSITRGGFGGFGHGFSMGG